MSRIDLAFTGEEAGRDAANPAAFGSFPKSCAPTSIAQSRRLTENHLDALHQFRHT
jgi:hypothetical protein